VKLILKNKKKMSESNQSSPSNPEPSTATSQTGQPTVMEEDLRQAVEDGLLQYFRVFASSPTTISPLHKDLTLSILHELVEIRRELKKGNSKPKK